MYMVYGRNTQVLYDGKASNMVNVRGKEENISHFIQTMLTPITKGGHGMCHWG